MANYPDVDDKTNISLMLADLKECLTGGLSKQKWRRFDKSFDALAEAREAALLAEKEKEKPKFSNAALHIAVIGAQSRIGATTFALRLAAYFGGRNAESVVVCANKRGEYQLDGIKELLDGSEQDGIISVGGIDICTTSVEPQKKYNAEIYDFGAKNTAEMDFTGFDKVYLVGGTSWNELPMIYDAQAALNKVNYSAAINFSSAQEIEKYREYLSVNLNDVILLPYEPNVFLVEKYEEIFDGEFLEWADSEETVELTE